MLLEALMEKVWIEKLAIQELCSRYCQTIDAHDFAERNNFSSRAAARVRVAKKWEH
jgi:hypothetical protein